MDKVKQLKKLGYTVGIATMGGEFWAHPETGSPVQEDFEGAEKRERATVYHVQGFGLATYVPEGDDEQWASLLDKSQHAERVQQTKEANAETLLRWHDDPGRDFELAREAAEQLRAEVARG